MRAVIPQNEKYLRDACGSAITDGACVIDHDHVAGYARLDLGPHCVGPGSAYWDGWFNVTRTRSEHPLRDKVLKDNLVQLLRGGRS